jgi:hypothetical protein
VGQDSGNYVILIENRTAPADTPGVSLGHVFREHVILFTIRLLRAALIGSVVLGLLFGFVLPLPDAPVERLLKNMHHYVLFHPGDAEGYDTPGRIYYLSFATQRKSLPAMGNVPISVAGDPALFSCLSPHD